ncbi:MAG: aspartate aminotransferase family protein [Candidatus Bathyarchaeia archaeon]
MSTFANRTAKSKGIYEEIRQRLVPGGVHSNIRFMEPHPLWFSRAKGSRIWDVDGNEYIDCVINMAGLILGHGDERVTQAVRNQIDQGLTCGMETELNVQVAKRLNAMIPCAESVKFSNTGTEAVMKAIMIARGYSGKQAIIKIEGGYNGWQDTVAVSFNPDLKKAGPRKRPRAVPENQGILRKAVSSTIVMPYNDLETAHRLIKKNRKTLAAVLVEPVAFNMGCVRPLEGYLKGLREITNRYGILLIFDEIISGFRVAPGGGQEYYGVTPDLATFAKAIANGYPMSAVAGQADVMEVSGPHRKVGWAGVYNGSQASVAASSATLEAIKDGEVQRKLNNESNELEKRFAELAREEKVTARLQGLGGQFQVYFTDEPVTDYRSACKADQSKFNVFREHMLNEGIFMLPGRFFHHGLVEAHSPHDLDQIVSAMRGGLQKVHKLMS